ncbi:MAG: AraC family transcriptional regulator [Paracoccaceae bacterium]|nr:AraC family transcriptional regulator [Paracoccaceae bacterium]
MNPLHALFQQAPWRLAGLRAYPEIRLYWITRGQGRVSIDAVTRGFGPNMLIFAPPGSVHALSPTAGCQGFAITMSPNLLLDMPDHPLLLRSETVIEQGELSGLLERIRTESAGDDPSAWTATLGYLALLSVWIARHAARNEWDTETRPDASIRLARRFLHQLETDISASPSVASIARRLDVTATHLGRVCHKVFASQASRMVQERQVLEARYLLCDTGLRIGEIAQRSGVSAPATFTRLFQRHTGMTPRAFRQRMSQPGDAIPSARR